MRTIVRTTWLALLLSALAFAADPAKITPTEAAKQVDQGKALLIDVREKDEVDDGMAAPARWFPTSTEAAKPGALKDFLKGVPKDRELIFYCASGGRAGRMAATAAKLGYRTANMGGFSSWQKAGLPVKKP